MANLKPLLQPTSSLSGVSSVAPTSPVLKSLPEGTEQVNLTREAFDRKEFNDTINTNFTELGLSATQEQDLSFFDPNLATVGDFFTIYQNLFYSIPKGNIIEGEEVNSHIFLIERSTAYIGFIAQQEEIDALTQEITDLRTQNLELVADMANIVEGFEQTVADLSSQITT